MLRDRLRRCATSYPEKVAYYQGERSRTWSQVYERSVRFAAALQRLGVRKGDAVAILSRECIEVYEHFYACMIIGAVRVGVNWRYSPAEMTRRGDALSIHIRTSDGAADLKVTADLGATDEQLPPGSVFTSAHDARRFAGPLPFTFDYEQSTHSIVMIKGQRQGWSPRLVPVQVEQANFLEAPPFVESRPTLCSAFCVHDIPYRWLRGVRARLDS